MKLPAVNTPPNLKKRICLENVNTMIPEVVVHNYDYPSLCLETMNRRNVVRLFNGPFLTVTEYEDRKRW